MRIVAYLLFSIILASCQGQNKDVLKESQFTNNLITETSPYLLQHANNPVNWNGWNEETLEKAKTEGKLMIVSIGYAACHWCHVMEHESFEDTTVANVMNKNYISVKVDREERPDIDQVYINAVQLMTGSAGWPLNVITLPDGRPVWGGTYFKKDDWINALQQIQKVYDQEPENLEEYAQKLEQGIKNADLITLNFENVDLKNFGTINLIEGWKKNFDLRFGGYNRAPKFMMPNNWHYLLRNAVQNNDAGLLDHIALTLDQMAFGGLYDQIGGGFSRYSVDEKWHVPHFEKMLYDNAQLVSLYSDAYLVTKNGLYKNVVEETLAFIEKELTGNEGAFYSSLDADSENAEGKLEEGAYYVYTKDELKKLLPEDFDLFAEYYNVNSFGKWENNYVLIRDMSDAEFVKKHSITEEVLQKKKKYWRGLLSAFRNERAKPRLDDKTLTSWNALMLKGYVDAYKVFGKKEYLETALKNARFISEKQMDANGRLFHNYKNGKSNINGYLEDYSATIQAYISLYEVTLDEQWLNRSKKLAEYCYTYFYDADKHMFYFTSTEDPKLITRNFEYRDNVIPASNSMMAKNLFLLSHYFDSEKYKITSKQMLKNVIPEMEQYPSGYSNWLDLLANYQNDFYEVVIVGENALTKTKEINSNYIPNKLIAGSISENESYLLENRFSKGKTLIYVCVNNTCKLPTNDTKEAINSIRIKN